MHIERAFRHLLELEAEFELFQRQANGIHYWDAIRSPVYYEVLRQADVYEQDGSNTGDTGPSVGGKAVGRLRGLYHGAKSVLFNSPLRVGRRNLLFVAAATERRERQADGTWWDVLCDPLCDQLGRSYVSLESSQAIHRYDVTPVKTRHTRYADYIDTWYGLRTLLDSIEVSIDARERAFLADASRAFNDRYGSEIDLEQYVVEELRERAVKVPLYRQLLARIAPKAVIIRYNPDKSVLIHACNEAAVPVIEFQHGAISKYNPDFSYPNHEEGVLTFPDYVFLFGEFWRRDITYPTESYVVGWPYLEHRRQQFAGEQPADHLLFISAPAVGESLSKLAAATSLCGEAPDIVYKLHPLERPDWRRRYPWLVGADLTVAADAAPSLHELMAGAIAQVGVSSTAIYEGMSFGLPTFLYDHPLLDNMHRLLDLETIPVVRSADELLESLQATPGPPMDPDRLFAPNAIERTDAAIEDVLRTDDS